MSANAVLAGLFWSIAGPAMAAKSITDADDEGWYGVRGGIPAPTRTKQTSRSKGRSLKTKAKTGF